ncbi:2,3-bisphosphoglycerate-independent phosphoglycerate mutase [Candidatus Xenohaliotis californiensis]|uniref:2,3-bisphosphoglycerate-independent phosphoglycerate mutase n=1 Tax=Candidatus Xenohaliotis californiensis TaxID=84677 RepID=A0ABP0ETS7_9RICK|nr:2,3-bisphosphoglycerate-independent phosphoglycerate mutase [Candidatus Xenohaliotis californiensis]
MKVILCILDGWGHSLEVENNAIRQASLKYNLFWDSLLQSTPWSLLNASGEAVGLSNGFPGNSEVGHITIGSGRVVKQSLCRINDAIVSGMLKNNQNLLNLISVIAKDGGDLHLMGLLSSGGVHSLLNHIIYLAKFSSENNLRVKLHLFLDGRDVPPKSAIGFLEDLNKEISDNSRIEISTISGRYYAMDRDNNWDRTKLAYNAIIKGKGRKVNNIKKMINIAYSLGITDEFITPFVVNGYTGAKKSDGMLLANFRKDRAVQLFGAMSELDFKDNLKFFDTNKSLGMMKYLSSFNAPVIFEDIMIDNVIGEVLAKNNILQFRVAETEKYNHVTSFLNGGYDIKFPGESRMMIPSPKVISYDLCPAMSAELVTDAIVKHSKNFDLTVVNYANPDMVGHTGNMSAAIQAVITVDRSLQRLVSYAAANNIAMLVTADHGNIEKIFNTASGDFVTSHTTNPVYFVPIGVKASKVSGGGLCDISPTVLHLLNIKKPSKMDGVSLLL